jgi:hypothetical protein
VSQGKGDARRPSNVSRAEYEARWAATFKPWRVVGLDGEWATELEALRAMAEDKNPSLILVKITALDATERTGSRNSQ